MDADAEQGSLMASLSGFSDPAVRRGFIRKVYGILALQLCVTMGIIGIFFIENVRLYVAHNMWLFWVSLVANIVLLIALACCSELRRKSPENLICLGLFTVTEGVLLGCVVSLYSANEVLMAVGITTILVLALTIFAMQTRYDFTAMGGILLAGLLCLMLFGLFVWIFPGSKVVNIIYAALGAFIFSCYIIYNTQLMLGGKHKYSLSPEEYIFAALNLYIDIINLFLYILTMIGVARD